MADITQIPSARVPLIYEGDVVMTTQWYRYFYNLYGFTGGGTGAIPTNRGGTGQVIYTDGQLLIGNSTTGSLDKATITGGAGINVTNGPGSIALSLGGSGVTPGIYGNASTVPQLTINEYGIISLAANVNIAISAAQIVSGTIDSARISGAYPGITGVGTISSGIWQGTAISVPYGGTGLTSYTLGDMLYATGTTALSKLAIGANTYILASTGTAPQWVAPSTISIGAATNLAGGLANQIPYQTGPGATTFMVAPTVANTYLNWSGSAFQWSSNPLGTVTNVSGTAPISVATGTTTPVISISQATTSTDGYLSSTDWNTFNSKANAFTYTTNYIPYGQGTTTPNQSVGLQYDGTTFTTTGISTSNNLTFTGTGNRIYGDWSTATLTDRPSFQTSVVNGLTSILALPNGTGTLSQWIASNNSDPTNAGVTRLYISNTESRLEAGRTGTGTYLPLTFYTNGVERLRFTLNGGAAFNGATNYGTSGQVLTSAGDAPPTWATPTVGDVVGPASATDEAIARFDTTTGKLIQNSSATINDLGQLTLGTGLSFSTNLLTIRADAGASVTPSITIDEYGATLGSFAFRRAGGTIASPTATTATSVISILGTTTGDGTTYANTTAIQSLLETLATPTSQPTALTFAVTPSGSITRSEVLRLRSTGAVAFSGATNYGTSGQVLTSAGNAPPTWTTPTTGTVTSVSGTGTVNGITLTGTVTSTGSLTLGGTLGGIGNSQLTNSTISGVALGGSLFNLTAGTGVSFSAGTTYNGSTAITINATGTGGTVTSVAALTLGTTGTDLSSTVANGTTTPVITLNVPTASAANRGALSSTDWSTFNGKQAALVSGTNIKTVGGASLLGSGDVGTIGTAYGGTGLTTFTANRIFYASSTSVIAQSAGLTFNGTNFATTGTSSALSFTATGGRSGFSAASEPYAIGVKYVSTGGNVYFGAVDGTATPDGQISNAGGSSVVIFKNSRAVQFPAYGAGTLTTDASGNITAVSDENNKQNIRPFTKGLVEIVALANASNGVILYGYTPESGLDQTKDDYVGWSAQQVQKLIPEAVGKMADTLDSEGKIVEKGCLTLNPIAITAAMNNAIKELNDLLTQQAQTIAIMQAKIDALSSTP